MIFSSDNIFIIIVFILSLILLALNLVVVMELIRIFVWDELRKYMKSLVFQALYKLVKDQDLENVDNKTLNEIADYVIRKNAFYQYDFVEGEPFNDEE